MEAPLTLAEARPHIEAALSYAGGTHTFEDVAGMVDDGRLQFWPGPRSVIVTEIIEYPRCRSLHFFLAGGRLEELRLMLPPILAWGKRQGCTNATLTGRKGWTRSFLVDEGWHDSLVLMTKEL